MSWRGMAPPVGSSTQVDSQSDAIRSAICPEIEVACTADMAPKARLIGLRSSDVVHLATHAFSVGPVRTAVIPYADDTESLMRFPSWPTMRAGLALAGANAGVDWLTRPRTTVW